LVRLRLNERWVLSNNNGKGKSSLSASAGGIKRTGVTGREDNEENGNECWKRLELQRR